MTTNSHSICTRFGIHNSDIHTVQQSYLIITYPAWNEYKVGPGDTQTAIGVKWARRLKQYTSSIALFGLKLLYNLPRATSNLPKFADTARRSASNGSVIEPDSSSLKSNPPGLRRKISMAFCKGQLEPTVVHRTQFKGRPCIISIEQEMNDKAVQQITLDTSPSTSGADSTSTGLKSSHPSAGESTAKTSVDSKTSKKSKKSPASQTSSETKRVVPNQATARGGSNENVLTTITETEGIEAPDPVPTVVTAEKAATAKVFFECHYNDVTSGALTNRSLRRRQLEAALYDDIVSSEAEKDDKRRAWAKMESDHLREFRAMKIRSLTALKGEDVIAARYEVVKVLGKGSFGVVRLVREKGEKDTPPGCQKKRRDIYAMKVIRKSDMLRNSQEAHLRAERDFLVFAEGSRWVVPLIASLQDLNHLYLVMEYMPGGDFLGLLIRDNVLSEPVTKWYIAEMILCIEEAHALRWIHRDIKPDNFLISASGHLKISDFGLAFDGHWSHDQSYINNHRYSLLTSLGITVDGDSVDKKEECSVATAMEIAHKLVGGKGRHERHVPEVSETEGILNWRNRKCNRALARSVVGTSQYMAPEVVRGEPYDARCDWWSVAVIMYECLYGYTPFLTEGGRQQTKTNIINHKETFAFPPKPVVSKRCQDLIRGIIQEKENRLSSRRYKSNHQAPGSRQNKDYAGRYIYPHDAEDIKAHKWFRDIQWDRMHMMVPPFVPNIKSLDDTHYFDEEESISDFSGSKSNTEPASAEITDALRPFNPEIRGLAKAFIARPHDSTRLRKAEKEIDTFPVGEEQKEYLKAFVKHYGKKEKKPPRDRLLRDKESAPKVLELRKRGAFLGYTYRRFRGGRQSIGRAASQGTIPIMVGSSAGKRVWYRARLSTH
ncbi:Protein kinase-like (PK-like) [Venustampulla echinocandica]|uniref:non-specific serine/threonine protein kinase n=1 Tax=Venustampulla echinocandica TaxID=2656787 RepID=A0A370TH53_9HELO|nr:Protein kinase-like (PK-like) [Venustampulla echinocandica]RDL34531.1 Protein kinase-like (PK-like) [Venustampulla echinocandica]